MSDLGRVLSSTPLRTRQIVTEVEVDGVSTQVHCAEFWYLDESHSDGFNVACALDIKTGSIYSAFGVIWSA